MHKLKPETYRRQLLPMSGTAGTVIWNFGSTITEIAKQAEPLLAGSEARCFVEL